MNSNATLVRNTEHVQTAELIEWSDFHLFCKQSRDLWFAFRAEGLLSAAAIVSHFSGFFKLFWITTQKHLDAYKKIAGTAFSFNDHFQQYLSAFLVTKCIKCISAETAATGSFSFSQQQEINDHVSCFLTAGNYNQK